MQTSRSRLANVPYRVFLGALLLRSAVVWLGVRAAVALLGGVDLALYASVAVVAVVSWLTYRDAYRRNEVLFLANLGVRGWVMAAFAAVPPAIFEGVAWLAL